jgi:hypothetical protein
MTTISHTEADLQTRLASEPQLTSLPTQGQLLLPLLETLHESGGQAKPNEVYESLATKIQLPQWLRHLRTLAGRAGEINVWERRVRNTRQQAAEHGLVWDPFAGSGVTAQVAEENRPALDYQ